MYLFCFVFYYLIDSFNLFFVQQQPQQQLQQQHNMENYSIEFYFIIF